MKNIANWLGRHRHISTCVVGTLVTISLSRTVLAQDRAALAQDLDRKVGSQQTPTKYMRLTKTDLGEPQSLEVAITKLRSTQPGGITVDLIGAVHIGERQYYDQLNKLFDDYDVLLYELVAPENTVIPRGGKREQTNPVAMLQDTAKNMLGLESQLELVDYTKAHFVRADMTPQQISDKMIERGETPLTIALSTLADVMRQQNAVAKTATQDEGIVAAEINLFDLMGNPLKMKQVLAQHFAMTGSLDQALGGALNQMLVIDRNGEALKGLQKQITAGKKKIGIFYGAAHMPDFEKRLVADFGMQQSEQNWLTAWDLRQGPSSSATAPTNLLINVLKALAE